jgi:hypothetical protein
MVNLRCIIFLSPKLSLILPYLKFPVRVSAPKVILDCSLKRRVAHLWYLLQAEKGQQTLSTRGSCLTHLFHLGHILTQGFWIIVQHSQGSSWDLYCSGRFHSSVRIYLSNEKMSDKLWFIWQTDTGLSGRTFSICHKEQKCQRPY